MTSPQVVALVVVLFTVVGCYARLFWHKGA